MKPKHRKIFAEWLQSEIDSLRCMSVLTKSGEALLHSFIEVLHRIKPSHKTADIVFRDRGVTNDRP